MKIIHDWRWSFRLLPDALNDLRIAPQAVIHVGAHQGEEVPIYLSCGFQKITLIEPDPDNCAIMAGAPWIDNLGVGLINKACGPAGKGTFHRVASTAFSGLRQDKRQDSKGTLHVDVIPVSDVQQTHPGNVLVVDTQGTELDVLRTANLSTLDLIVVETQTRAPGGYAAYEPDLVEWARGEGWEPAVQWLREHGGADTLLTPMRVK